VVVEQLTALVQSWRIDRSRMLQDGLLDVIEQARDDVATQVRQAHQAVRDTLALTLSSTTPRPELDVDVDFRLDFSPGARWAPPLEHVVQQIMARLAPNRRRRRIHARLTADIARLADRQIGRARADLQQRLDAAGHQLAHRLDDEFAQTIDRLRDLVAERASDDERGQEQRMRHRDELADRVATLEHLLTLLDAP
jgi:hypothetical protein